MLLDGIAVSDGTDLVLERLPNGEMAWLRPVEEEPRYTITAAGRVALAEHAQEDHDRAAGIAWLNSLRTKIDRNRGVA